MKKNEFEVPKTMSQTCHGGGGSTTGKSPGWSDEKFEVPKTMSQTCHGGGGSTTGKSPGCSEENVK